LAQRKDSRQASETLQEIESVFDRLARWVAGNPRQVLGLLAAVLVATALLSFWNWGRDRSETGASAAVAQVQAAYLSAMGAPPGSFEVVEPANPEVGRQVRREFVARFLEVADEHAGAASAVSARLEAAALQDQAGDGEAALESWRRAADEAEDESALKGLALVRLARALESRSRWEEAGAAHEEAGGIEEMPMRILALADAARCFAEAGDVERALAILERIETEAPDARLPAHTKARLLELRAARSSGAEEATREESLEARSDSADR
jgi:predicted negative regulator of RcsB-dependent stress response